ANRLLQYRIMPSAARVSAPSRICSTMWRYGWSAVRNVKISSPCCVRTTSASTCPSRIAWIVSSASFSRRSSSRTRRDGGFLDFRLAMGSMRQRRLQRADVEPRKQARFVRHVSNHPFDRQRLGLDQRGRRNHVVLSRERQVLVQIDHFELVPPAEMLVAHALDVSDGMHRPASGAGDVESEDVVLTAAATLHAGPCRRGASCRNSRPTSRRS